MPWIQVWRIPCQMLCDDRDLSVNHYMTSHIMRCSPYAILFHMRSLAIGPTHIMMATNQERDKKSKLCMTHDRGMWLVTHLCMLYVLLESHGVSHSFIHDTCFFMINIHVCLYYWAMMIMLCTWMIIYGSFQNKPNVK